MLDFSSETVRQARLMIALNNGNIDEILKKESFNNVGIMILLNGNTSERIANVLLKDTQFANDDNIKAKVKQMIDGIMNKFSQEVLQYYHQKTIGQLLKKRTENGDFKKAMDEIAQDVKTQFKDIITKFAQQTHSQQYYDNQLLKNWRNTNN